MKELYFDKDAILKMIGHFEEMVNLYKNEQRTLIALKSELDNELVMFEHSYKNLISQIEEDIEIMPRAESKIYLKSLRNNLKENGSDKISSAAILSITKIFDKEVSDNIFRNFIKKYLEIVKKNLIKIKKLEKKLTN